MSGRGAYAQALIMGAIGGLGITVAGESAGWFHWAFSAVSGMLIVVGASFLATEERIRRDEDPDKFIERLRRERGR